MRFRRRTHLEVAWRIKWTQRHRASAKSVTERKHHEARATSIGAANDALTDWLTNRLLAHIRPDQERR
jgi:hypothetical protein